MVDDSFGDGAGRVSSSRNDAVETRFGVVASGRGLFEVTWSGSLTRPRILLSN